MKTMKDIGEDRRDPEVAIAAPGSKRTYPGLSINDSVLPFLKDVVIGSEIKVEALIRVTGTREPEDWDTTQKGNYVSVEIIKIGEPAEHP